MKKVFFSDIAAIPSDFFPSSLDENLEPIDPSNTAHRWDDTANPITCAEFGTQRTKYPYECGSCEYAGKYPTEMQPQKGFETFFHCENCGCAHCQEHPICASRNGEACDCKQ